MFREAFRVLKPAGRLAISDVIALGPIPENIRQDMDLYTACAGGAALMEDVKAMLEKAGFKDIRVEPKPRSREVIREWYPDRGLENYFASATIEAVKPNAP
jgi:arsenite methyltransferase